MDELSFIAICLSLAALTLTLVTLNMTHTERKRRTKDVPISKTVALSTDDTGLKVTGKIYNGKLETTRVSYFDIHSLPNFAPGRTGHVIVSRDQMVGASYSLALQYEKYLLELCAEYELQMRMEDESDGTHIYWRPVDKLSRLERMSED